MCTRIPNTLACICIPITGTTADAGHAGRPGAPVSPAAHSPLKHPHHTTRSTRFVPALSLCQPPHETRTQVAGFSKHLGRDTGFVVAQVRLSPAEDGTACGGPHPLATALPRPHTHPPPLPSLTAPPPPLDVSACAGRCGRPRVCRGPLADPGGPIMARGAFHPLLGQRAPWQPTAPLAASPAAPTRQGPREREWR